MDKRESLTEDRIMRQKAKDFIKNHAGVDLKKHRSYVTLIKKIFTQEEKEERKEEKEYLLAKAVDIVTKMQKKVVEN